ncbi:hypothetical protein KIN20_022182 [Parelaphostrongylus tenuis]|uniref:Uncharacterized protein n=1 Tax=Parelaphostrongylus tenuis TaxID=148309 RepID=A0AAD5MPU9_PARTN|nr:hypothetical protein KIN20_022182 [Parelaphostrongylus tenuis]
MPLLFFLPEFRPQDDEETINECVSNWGAVQTQPNLLKKGTPAKTPKQQGGTPNLPPGASPPPPWTFPPLPGAIHRHHRNQLLLLLNLME